MGHILSKQDEWFLNQKKVDPDTRKKFSVGDSVVVCKNCYTVHLEECWKLIGHCSKCEHKEYTSVFTKSTVIPPVIDIRAKRGNKQRSNSASVNQGTTNTRTLSQERSQRNNSASVNQRTTNERTFSQERSQGNNRTVENDVRYVAERNRHLFLAGIVYPIMMILLHFFCLYYDFPFNASPLGIEIIAVCVSLATGYRYLYMEDKPLQATNGSYAGALMMIISFIIAIALAVWWLISKMFDFSYTVGYYLNWVFLGSLIIEYFIAVICFYKDLRYGVKALFAKTGIAVLLCVTIVLSATNYYFTGTLRPYNPFGAFGHDDTVLFPEEDVVYDIPNDFDYMLPYADSMIYSWSSLQGMGEEEVQFAINEIYAREGRIFQEEPYKSYFDSCYWFNGQYTLDEFDDSVFNYYEQENIKLLVEYAKYKGYR